EHSNREIADFSQIDLDQLPELPRLVRREITGRSERICGIMMNDALLTGEDLQLLTAPRRWGAIVNNGCATWTSLAADFVRKGATAYVGTLWPVGDDVAFSVGASLLQHAHEEPLATALAHAVQD